MKPLTVDAFVYSQDQVTHNSLMQVAEEPSGLPTIPSNETISAPAHPPVTATGKAVF